MRKTALTTAAFVGFLLLCSCSGSDDSELISVVDFDSGDAFDSDETSPRTSDEGVTRLVYPSDAGKSPAAGELAQGDAGDAPIDAGDAAEESPDAAEESPEALDAAEESPDAAEESPEASEESPDAAEDLDAGENDGAAVDAGDGCAGTWEVIVTPQIYCFRSDKPFVLELDDCTADLEISLDLTDPLYGHFVGTIAYSFAFAGDSLSGTADINGVVTLSETVTGPCISTATLLGNRR